MALYVIAVFGTRVVGGPIVGWFGEHMGTRASLGIGALSITVVLPLWLIFAPRDREPGATPQYEWTEPDVET
jgi:hypothetical protein